MSLPTFNTKSPTIKRILKEASELSTHPDPTLHASPLESNLFEWHFTLAGPPSSPYSNGIYHGRIILPPSYPLRPPSFRFLTPSGRFEVNREICLSISGHHEETWQPAWGIRTALWALRAFMEGGAKGQVGGMEMGDGERKRLAEESRNWRCGGCGGKCNKDVLREEAEKLTNQGDELDGRQEKIPEELKFGFRDVMEKKDNGAGSANEKTLESRGPVQSPTAAPIPESSLSSAVPSTSHQPSSTPTTSHHGSSAQPRTLLQQPPALRPSSSDPVPVWIDKAIIGVAVGLALLIVKKFLL